jgi:hypothetical protein
MKPNDPARFQQAPEYIPDQPAIPERNLIAKVLERAICDILNGPCEVHVRANAIQWLKSDESCPDSMSYVWICEQLDLNHETLRNIVLNWRHEGARFEVQGERKGLGESGLNKRRLELVP